MNQLRPASKSSPSGSNSPAAVSAVAATFSNDTGAYFAGRFLGPTFPRKLYETMSPKKTLVGSFGGVAAPESSVFIGQNGVRSNRDNWWNFLKDAFLKSHRAEMVAKLRELDKTVLSPENVSRLVDDAAGEYVLSEAMAAPAAAVNINNCDGAAALATRIKEFAETRRYRIREGLFD